MTTVTVQRTMPRYPVVLPVRYTTGNLPAVKAGVGWTRYLSEEGANVELDGRLRPQTPLRMHLETDRGPIGIGAKVVWVGEIMPPAAGALHGLVFTQITPDQLQALRDLLLPLSLVRHAGVRLPVDLPVTCRSKEVEGGCLEGRTEDICRGGLSFRVPQVLTLGAELGLTLHTPEEPVSVEGAIVWVEAPEKRAAGHPILHGLRFTSVDWSISLAISLILAHSN